MPIYEYECTSCKHRFDEIQKFSDPPIQSCPQCAHQVRKLLFPAAVHFKGGGFYATEYGKSKAPSTTATEPKSETKTDGSCPRKDGCAANASKAEKAAVG